MNVKRLVEVYLALSIFDDGFRFSLSDNWYACLSAILKLNALERKFRISKTSRKVRIAE